MQVSVTGESDLGWDEHTPPNETVDADGNPFPAEPGFGVPDPYAPAARRYDDPGVVALRAHLAAHNGIDGLEICAPDEVYRIARILRRDGFVVVRDLLDAAQLALWRRGCERVLEQILSVPGQGQRAYVTETSRLPHRYSYGTCSATRHLLHEPEWVEMVHLPSTAPILEAIFGDDGYLLSGAGGDLCLPGAIEYQHLHGDVIDDHVISEGRLAQAKGLGMDVPELVADLDFGTARHILERTPPMVTINFLMSDLTWENGPIRQIPGTHTSVQRPPSPRYEPDWMKTSTLAGALSGAGVFRDNRAWHGATPNLSREVRAMPNIEYVPRWQARRIERSMPHELWLTLDEQGRQIARATACPEGQGPAGAGVMHPLLAERQKAAGG